MNTSHYPSLELCKRITAHGFPRTEKGILDYGYERPNQGDIFKYDFCLDCEGDEGETYKCPSIAELLDELPVNGWDTPKIVKNYIGWYVAYEGEDHEAIWEGQYDNLPNALAEMWLWLKENNLLTNK